ncbi:unnamed protein product [Prorocentrum cordatum]|uniref:Uncharacterized protein n=1 Tax=Prorocentrum cordatum TaxID=2364126 RepID=A0ABN9T736_9DINO|nr:unnamed protein product [Polarella glacialis]
MELEHLQGIGLQTVATPSCTAGFQREPCPAAAVAPAVPAALRRQVEQCSRGSEHDVPPPAFLDLPDVVETIGETCCEPQLLARLGVASRQMRECVGGTDFALRRAEEMRRRGAAWAEGCATLELLALGLQVQELCMGPTKNHVYFPYGGGTDPRAVTMPLIDGAAVVGKRFPRVRLHVDAHVGKAAPGFIAKTCSLHRARVVLRALASRGVAEGQLSSTAWGKQVQLCWSEPDDDTAARAEVYFSLGGREFPPRPGYYGLVASPPEPEVGLGLDPDLEDRDLRDEADARRRLVGLISLRQGLAVRPRGLLQALPFLRRLPASGGSTVGAAASPPTA